VPEAIAVRVKVVPHSALVEAGETLTTGRFETQMVPLDPRPEVTHASPGLRAGNTREAKLLA
jgi:hypothetical protein